MYIYVILWRVICSDAHSKMSLLMRSPLMALIFWDSNWDSTFHRREWQSNGSVPQLPISSNNDTILTHEHKMRWLLRGNRRPRPRNAFRNAFNLKTVTLKSGIYFHLVPPLSAVLEIQSPSGSFASDSTTDTGTVSSGWLTDPIRRVTVTCLVSGTWTN